VSTPRPREVVIAHLEIVPRDTSSTLLRERGIGAIAVCGIQTNFCC